MPRSDPWLERLTGARSSKQSFYAEWRRKSHGLDRAVEALRAISAALCTTTSGPDALCDAVVAALARHFGAPAVSLTLVARPEFRRGVVPDGFAGLASRTRVEARPVTTAGLVGVPVLLDGECTGSLLVELPGEFDESDVAILQTVANQLAVALENACLYQEAGRRTRELEERNRQLEVAHRRLGEAGQRQLISQERHRIARELHDSVAQHLISIGMNLEWCRKQEPSSPVGRQVAVTKELARSALTQMRAAIFELSELDTQHSGMRGVLLDLVHEFRAITPLRVRFRVRGEPVTLSLATQHALFHIAQEAMFNVARHAAARSIWVALTYRPGAVTLTVADDGTGDPRAIQRRLIRAAAPGGLGNIRERARELDGTARVLPRRGGGVRVRVDVPVDGSDGPVDGLVDRDG
ncbi:histidine kinase [Actinophytocola sp.]|uniref:GAF domain-containing sensor histidine kinase n=1 Tax=Actinophytocola sp. TaxID=1872138 RepID=UPI003D6A8AEA